MTNKELSEFKTKQEYYRCNPERMIADANDRKNKETFFVVKPTERPKKQTATTKIDELDNFKRTGVPHHDNWMNLFTGLGTRGDKSAYTSFSGYTWLDDRLLSELWVGDGFAKKISSCFADDSTREWIKIKNDTDNELFNKLVKLKSANAFNKALKWRRHFGGSLIVMGINDGGKLEEPVDMNKIKSVDYLRVYDRVRVYMTNFNFMQDPEDPNYGNPEFYTIFPQWSAAYNVHRSRVLIFKGLEVPEWMMSTRWWFWGMSCIQPIWTDLKNLAAGVNHIVKLLYEFTMGKYKVKNLAQIMSEDDGTNKVMEMLDIIDLGKSIINAYILDADGEDFTRDSVGVSGLPELLDRYMILLSGVSNTPVTKLFGRSAAGLNATGENDQDDYDDAVKSDQENYLKPEIQTLVDIINASKEIKKKVKEPIVEFNPLKQMSEKEKLANQLVQAQIDKIYTNDTGVLNEEEVRTSRFENGYSFDTQLIEQMEAPGKPEPVIPPNMLPGQGLNENPDNPKENQSLSGIESLAGASGKSIKVLEDPDLTEESKNNGFPGKPTKAKTKKDGFYDRLKKRFDNIFDGGPGSGRHKETFSLSIAKMKKIPMPKNLKKKWAKNGGVSNPEYKQWIKENWKSDNEEMTEIFDNIMEIQFEAIDD